MAHVSLREFARRNEWNPGYAHKLKMAGRLVMVQEGDKELVDFEASMRRIEQSRDLGKEHMIDVNAQQRAAHRMPRSAAGEHSAPNGPAGGSSTNSTYHQAKTAREVYEAKNAQLDFEERSGRLVNVEVVRAKLQAKFAAVREAMRQIPARLTPIVAAESDPMVVQVLMQREIDSVLTEQAKRSPL